MQPDAPRARRRAQLLRRKARARRVMRLWSARTATPNPRDLGRNTSTHCRPCSCWLCQSGPRLIPPPRERAAHYPDAPCL